jgi:eukaryotic-like serine/threonine-protein kinase
MAFVAETQLGPYKIISLIGSGGMGEVYRARDIRLLRDVALKVLPASFTNDPDRLRRFEQEARAVAALNHPNIVSVYDVGNANGVHYIVSELLEGETLRSRIAPPGMPVRKAIELAVQLANGLAAAHEQGIVHRDLKPENIFITRNGRLKILDFGLAKLHQPHGIGETMDGTSVAATSAGQVLGTAGVLNEWLNVATEEGDLKEELKKLRPNWMRRPMRNTPNSLRTRFRRWLCTTNGSPRSMPLSMVRWTASAKRSLSE